MQRERDGAQGEAGGARPLLRGERRGGAEAEVLPQAGQRPVLYCIVVHKPLQVKLVETKAAKDEMCVNVQFNR